MKRWLHWLYLAIILATIPGILAASRVLPLEKKTLIEEKYSGWNGVLRVWLPESEKEMVGWLNRCASEFEKRHNGVYVQVQTVPDLGGLDAEGVRPPEIVMFTPGQSIRYDLLAELPRMPVRFPLQMTNIAVPLALGGYAWAINTDLIDAIPADCASLEIALPTDTEDASYSAALLALSTGVAPESSERPLPGVDLGLTPERAATEAPTVEAVPCRLPSDLTASPDAFARFQNGEAAAAVVGPAEIARLESLSAQGRGPDWRLEVTGTRAFTDQILLGAAVASGDERESLAVEFLQSLLQDDCQKLLGKYNRFSVTDAPTDLPAADPLTAVDASLRSDALLVPPAFFGEWRGETASALQNVLRGETTAEAALDALFG